MRDEDADYCLNAIQSELKKLRAEYKKDEKALRQFYGEPPS